MRTCQDKSLQLFKLLNFRCLHWTSSISTLLVYSDSLCRFTKLNMKSRGRTEKKCAHIRNGMMAFNVAAVWYPPKLSPFMHTIFKIIDWCQRNGWKTSNQSDLLLCSQHFFVVIMMICSWWAALHEKKMSRSRHNFRILYNYSAYFCINQ